MIRWIRHHKWLTAGAGLALLLFLGFSSIFLMGPAQGAVFTDVVSNYEMAPLQATQSAPSLSRGAGSAADETFTTASAAVQADGLLNPPNEPAPQQERVILRDATLRIVVEDTTATMDAIATNANELGGWVVNANTTRNSNSGGTYTTGTITVRVPAEDLDTVLAGIREGSAAVEQQQITGRDVTEEYVDLSSRLENLRATEEQLNEVMDQAFSVEDVLAVQRELTTVRGQIETIQGRLRFFDEAAAFSSVTVNIREEVPTIGNVEVQRWSPGQTAEDAFGTLVSISQNLANAVIVFVVVWLPLIAVFALVVGLSWRGVRWSWRRMFGSGSASQQET